MYQFKFADIGEGIHEGSILKWMFKEGDEVNEGDTLCLVETDKVNAELPSPVSGKIVELLAQVGDTVHVGDTIVKIDDGNEHVEDVVTSIEEDADEAITSSQDIEEKPSGVVGQIEISSKVIENNADDDDEEDEDRKVLATPVARKLAKDLGVDINQIKGSGPMGRVMKADIYQFVDQKEVKTEKPNVSFDMPELKFTGEVERKPITKLRKTIAKNMVMSKTIIPHVTSMDEIDVTNLVKYRKENKEKVEKMGTHLTYMPFIVKAVTHALKDYPIFNSSFDQDKEEIIYKKYYNIGIAVDTEDGLIVPVVKNADQLGIIPIANELKSIANDARDRTIGLDLLQDGTFTITNYGAVGSSYGVPIIRYPEVAILGVGMIKKQPVVKDGEIVIRDIMPVSLSYDHRIIDGATAGRFLTALKEYLTEPTLLLLS